jgi:hypothetical protein
LPEVTTVTALATPGNATTVKSVTRADAVMHDHRRDERAVRYLKKTPVASLGHRQDDTPTVGFEAN